MISECFTAAHPGRLVKAEGKINVEKYKEFLEDNLFQSENKLQSNIYFPCRKYHEAFKENYTEIFLEHFNLCIFLLEKTFIIFFYYFFSLLFCFLYNEHMNIFPQLFCGMSPL